MRYRWAICLLVLSLFITPSHAADKAEEAIKAGGAVAAGAAIGGGTFAVVGSGGLAIAGTAVTIGLAPFVAAGAVVGLAGYGVYRLVTHSGEPKPAAASPTAPAKPPAPVAKK